MSASRIRGISLRNFERIFFRIKRGRHYPATYPTVLNASCSLPVLVCASFKVIKKPMDLSLIRQRIMSGALMSLDDMSRDLFVMCNNAMVFNGKGDPYFDYSKVRAWLSYFSLRNPIELWAVCNLDNSTELRMGVKKRRRSQAMNQLPTTTFCLALGCANGVIANPAVGGTTCHKQAVHLEQDVITLFRNT